jgi:hypothetical protein
VSPVWRNHTGNQICHPAETARPQTLADLVDLVQRAEREGRTVRAAGARHSWSDVALTDGAMVEPDGLGSVEPVDPATVRPGLADADLVWVGSGTSLHALNPALERLGLALSNMGGYDAQTIAGVVATSTHGSGLAFGPFPDIVRSLELVVSGGRALRLEPADGPTDPQTFAEQDLELVQDDERFAAAICGLGTIGLLYRAMIEVRKKFWLKEVRTLDTWENIRAKLTPDGVLGEPGHYELFVNPYPGDDGRHRVLVTMRTDAPKPVDLPPDKLERHPLTELEASWKYTGVLLRFCARHFPSLLAKRFDSVLEGMCDDGYTNVSYKVFNIGEANALPAESMELGVAVDGRHLEAVDRIIAIAAERAREGIYHTSPFSLRFVAPSEAYASMMHGQPTMMIELIMVYESRGAQSLLVGCEDALASLGVRPHWGQINAIEPAQPPALYPMWDRWMAVEREYNASGVFDSPFTARVGISGDLEGRPYRVRAVTAGEGGIAGPATAIDQSPGKKPVYEDVEFGDEAPSRVILDPSILFTEEALGWLENPQLSPFLVVSEALWRHLQGPESNELLQYANGDSERILAARQALASSKVSKFSFEDARRNEEMPGGALEICEALLHEEGALADVFADEWAFLTSQSLAIVTERLHHSLNAFRRAGAEVFEFSRERMEGTLDELREAIPPGLLEAMKHADGRAVKLVVLGGRIAALLAGLSQVPAHIAEAVRAGVAVIAGDP